MMSVVLIVVGGLAFTVVMQAVAIDVLAVRANRAELAAANALTSGVNIVTSDIRRYGPDHYPADPLVIDRYPGDPYCDQGCWAVALSDPLIDRVVDLRGSGQVQTLEVWEATIYAASECQAAPAASPPVPFPGSVWWDEFDCLITDTTTLRFEPDPLPLYTLIIADLTNPCTTPAGVPAFARPVCDDPTQGIAQLTATAAAAQGGVLVLDAGAVPTVLCGTDSTDAVNVGGAGIAGLTGSCVSGFAPDTGDLIRWQFDGFDLATDLGAGACTANPALYNSINPHWGTDAADFTVTPAWLAGRLHRVVGDATIDLSSVTDVEAVLAAGTVTLTGRPSSVPAASTLVVFAGCNIILDLTGGDYFDNVLLVAAHSIWAQFGVGFDCSLPDPVTFNGTIIAGRTPFTFARVPTTTTTTIPGTTTTTIPGTTTTTTVAMCLGAPLQAEIPLDWSSKLVAYWPDRPYPWRRS